jgi:diketogulonate reductase-like aldo/keto reductase
LHWRGSIALAETIEAFERLKKNGKIRFWGVSNFDANDMKELMTLSSGPECAANQVLYHLGERGIEWDLLPECRRRGIPVMAYSPLGQGSILREPVLQRVAHKYGTTPAAVALAWVLRGEGVIAIPKSADVARTRENARAGDLQLDAEDLANLDKAFPPPEGPKPLAML